MAVNFPGVRWILRTPRRTIAVLAGNSLFFGLANASVTPHFIDAGQVVLPAFFATASLLRGILGTIGFVTGVMFDLYILYLIVNRTIGNSEFINVVRKDRIAVGSVLVAALPFIMATPLIIGFGVYRLWNGVTGLPLSPAFGQFYNIQYFVWTAIFAPIAFVILIYWRYWRPLSPALRADSLYRFNRRIHRSATQTRFPHTQYQFRLWYKYHHPLPQIYSGVLILFQALLLFVYALVGGVVIMALGALFPVLEVTVLLLAAGAAVSPRIPVSWPHLLTNTNNTDSSNIISSSFALMSSREGMFVFIYLMIAFIPMLVMTVVSVLGALELLMALSRLISTAGSQVRPWLIPSLELIPLSMALFALPVYIFWFWRRLLQRVIFEFSESAERTILPSRPPFIPVISGLMLILWLPVAFNRSIGWIGRVGNEVVDIATVLTFLLTITTLGLVVLGVNRTRNRNETPQASPHEMNVVVLATITFTFWGLIYWELAEIQGENSYVTLLYLNILVVVVYYLVRPKPKNESTKIFKLRSALIIPVIGFGFITLFILYPEISLTSSQVNLSVFTVLILTTVSTLFQYFGDPNLDDIPRTPETAEEFFKRLDETADLK